MLTLGQTLGLGCIAAVSFGFAATTDRTAHRLYAVGAALGVAGLAHFLVSIGWWRVACAIGVLASFAAIAAGMATIYVEERGQ